MEFKVSSPPFLHGPKSVTAMMLNVIYALIPGIILYVWFFGFGVIINIFIACITAVSVEALMLWLRGYPLRHFLTDASALVMAFLFAVAVPPYIPWWMTVLGVSFGMIFAKHLYGGLGNNLFNPAMLGYVVLLISFPVEMTQWPALSSLGTAQYPSFMDSFNIIFAGASIDSFSGATPLDTMKMGLSQAETVDAIKANPLFGNFGAKGWEWITIGFLFGGGWLIFKKVITWHIPVGVLASIFIISLIFFVVDSNGYPSPLFHIFSGATMLCAFFIATDPLSGAVSNKGRLIYGAGFGLLVYIIRTWGGYPDAVAFAALLMNMTVPTIDYYTKPRVFGHDK